MPKIKRKGGKNGKMTDTVIVALISLGGTVIGTFGGIVASSRITDYRIKQLERKVEKHNNIVERTYKLEGQVREAEHDIVELKGKR